MGKEASKELFEWYAKVAQDTDCYSEKTDGPLPDSLQDYYNAKFGV